MAVDMFLKIEQKGGKSLNGESQDAEHKDEIDVLAWSWGVSNSSSAHQGQGGGGGRAEFQDLSVTKFTDSASNVLQQRCFDGGHLEKLTLVVRKTGRTPIEFIKYELEDVIVASVSTGGSEGEDRLVENVVFNYGVIKTVYVPQKEDGSEDSERKAGWDLPENKKAK